MRLACIDGWLFLTVLTPMTEDVKILFDKSGIIQYMWEIVLLVNSNKIIWRCTSRRKISTTIKAISIEQIHTPSKDISPPLLSKIGNSLNSPLNFLRASTTLNHLLSDISLTLPESRKLLKRGCSMIKKNSHMSTKLRQKSLMTGISTQSISREPMWTQESPWVSGIE